MKKRFTMIHACAISIVRAVGVTKTVSQPYGFQVEILLLKPVWSHKSKKKIELQICINYINAINVTHPIRYLPVMKAFKISSALVMKKLDTVFSTDCMSSSIRLQNVKASNYIAIIAELYPFVNLFGISQNVKYFSKIKSEGYERSHVLLNMHKGISCNI